LPQDTGRLLHYTGDLKLIGVWKWGDAIKVNNHEPVVPEALFLTAYELALARTKPKGRAVYYEPMGWARAPVVLQP
jgi:hypothetical protein